ncbi:hypothetical protein NQ317_014785 [Molorchus minor]|uniref:Tyr recombinase domain-containing protein n=1 Tax=Molorchus minor TaxID=1323400 RepID=A0ABQ9J9F5_9CUCU|nr:hypothetical protein NQ317_014785 [Molorchus minor]
MLNVENNQDIKAPDDKYFMFKVVAVMGILGACRLELCQMSLNNIEDLGNALVVNIPDSKTRVSRTFTVITETYIALSYKCLALRPAHEKVYGSFIPATPATILANSGADIRTLKRWGLEVTLLPKDMPAAYPSLENK